MKTFKLSNTNDAEMLVIFEPIGDVFNLPSGEHLQLLVYDDEVGISTDSLHIEFGVNKGKAQVTIRAEKNKFEALYKGVTVNS